jgi:hypothetical protein
MAHTARKTCYTCLQWIATKTRVKL